MIIFRAVRYGQKRMLKLIHAGMSVAILILLVVGYWAILDGHYRYGKPNWYSLHAWVAVLSTALFLAQVT